MCVCVCSHQTVEVAGLHGLIETDDVRVSEAPHELGLTEEVLTNILFFDLISLNDLHRYLQIEIIYSQLLQWSIRTEMRTPQ